MPDRKQFAAVLALSFLLVGCGSATRTIYVKSDSPATITTPGGTSAGTSGGDTTTPPGSQINADGFGGGGKALGKLEAARALAVAALRKLKAGIDRDWICDQSQMNAEQQTACRSFILDNIDTLIARHTTDPIKFEISEKTLQDGLIAKTSYGPAGTILWSNDLVVAEDMTASHLVKFVLHESLHKLVNFLRDEDQLAAYPTANGGRVAADDAGEALEDYALAHLSYADYVVALSPMGYWRMNDRAGETPADASGHRLTGSITNLLKLDMTPGPLANVTANAPTFAATSGNINVTSAQMKLAIPAIPKGAGTAVTVSLWMKWAGTVGVQNSAVVVGFSSTYNLLLAANKFGFNTAHGDVWGVATPADFKNRWVHVVAVFNNGDPHRNKLYIDGKLQDGMQEFGAVPNIAAVSSTMLVGGWIDASSYPFHGSLAELSMHSGEISASEVAALYALGIGKY